jgi:tRNA(Ile)-lysidine synthase
MNRIIERMRRNPILPKEATIVLGFSGGPDSITLLHALCCLAPERNLTLVPVHVNHQLRENADAEERHAVQICEAWGLPCIVRRIDCRALAEEKHMSLEEAGRDARYQIFADVAEELAQNCSRESIAVAVAHNADDQCETLIQRILRGTGIRGLAGIPFVRKGIGGFPIIRPLRDSSRAEIEEYVRENHLEPNYDESNQEPEYLRNRIRLEVLPYLEEHYNPNVKQALLTLGEIAAGEDDYMEGIAAAELSRICENLNAQNGNTQNADELLKEKGEVCLNAEVLRTLHPAVAQRVIARLLRVLVTEGDVKYVTVTDVLKLAASESPSARLDLPGNYIVERQYEKLIFRKQDENDKSYDGRKYFDESTGITDSKRSSKACPNLEQPERERADLKQRREVPCDAKIKGCCPKRSLKITVEPSSALHPSGPFAKFDYEKLCEEFGARADNIVLRTRKAGDCIGIGNGKHKTIQNVFVDEKVPRAFRDQMLVAAVGNEVLWILPSPHFRSEMYQHKGKFSQNYQIREGSKILLFLELTDSV